MESFAGRVAVVTGAGTGMGRELVRQLAAAGCHVAGCDVRGDDLAVTRELALAGATGGARVEVGLADVADEAALGRFRDDVVAPHFGTAIHLLFNNAGIAGGGSFVAGPRDEWDRTFAVDFYGIVNATRAFLPLLLVADEGVVVNTSSINGLWASIGPRMPHTAYCAAKFAVRGLTEALHCDFAMHAPHLRAVCVLPGHVGTSIVLNSAEAHGRDPATMDAARVAELRTQLERSGIPTTGVTDDELRKAVVAIGESFRDTAPTTASEAAAEILRGVLEGRWRLLVGDDARAIDRAVRADPEAAYGEDFYLALREAGHLGGFAVGR